MATLVDVVVHLLLLCKILGITIFKTTSGSFITSKSQVIVNLIRILLFTSLVLYIFITLQSFNILIIIHIIQQIFAVILVITTWISGIYFQKNHIQLLKDLEVISHKFQSLGIWIYYGKKKKMVYCQLVARCLLITLSIVGQMTNIHSKADNLNFLFHIPLYFASTINSTQQQLIQTYISFIKENYQILNEHLIHLEEYSAQVLTPREKWKSMCPLKSKLEVLHIVIPIYHSLCKVVHTINDIFGVSLLASFGLTFILMIVDLYHLISTLDELKGRSVTMPFAILSNCFPYLVETINMCYICNSTTEEANAPGVIIHQLSIKDEHVQKTIELFSLQLSHEKIEFNAGGFFPINYALLFSIVGGVTTNLVILIQFSNGLNNK